MNRNLIIGYGIVGSNLKKELCDLNIDVYDKYKGIDEREEGIKYDLAFICVDTPKTEDDLNERTEVYNAIMENNADVFVIKSTVLPMTTEILEMETGKNIIFSPEYFGNTQHNLNFDFKFTILGGRKENCKKVQQILQKQFDARHTFRITDSRTAEVTKYMENSWLAMKVSFMQEFFELSKKVGIDFEDLRELFILDPRVNPSHTFVYEETPWWASHCLDKDVPAIANEYDMSLLKSVIDFNEGQKKKYKKD